jgi:hypothetical protein
MPLLANSVAVCSMTVSFRPLHPKWFQLFHPIGGVKANPLLDAPARGAKNRTKKIAHTASLGTKRQTGANLFKLRITPTTEIGIIVQE